MSQGGISQNEIDEIVRRTREGAKAYIRGDLRTYMTLIPHSRDYTLLQPFGGEPIYGVDDADKHVEAVAQFLRGGEAELEIVATHASDDMVVLVLIERQHGDVGGRCGRPWSTAVMTR